MSSVREAPAAKGGWVDTAAAILLAMAAVATAWSSYQASRWTGEQAKDFSAANAARVESTKVSNLANAQTQIDIALFTQWVGAHLSDDDELGNIRHGAEAAQLRDAQKPDDDADQQVGRTRHRQGVGADLLDQPRQRSPVDRAW